MSTIEETSSQITARSDTQGGGERLIEPATRSTRGLTVNFLGLFYGRPLAQRVLANAECPRRFRVVVIFTGSVFEPPGDRGRGHNMACNTKGPRDTARAGDNQAGADWRVGITWWCLGGGPYAGMVTMAWVNPLSEECLKGLLHLDEYHGIDFFRHLVENWAVKFK